MSGEQNRSEWCGFAMYKEAMEKKKKCWCAHNNVRNS